jgi:hypothetical protein
MTARRLTLVPDGLPCEGGLFCLRVAGTLDGVLASLADPGVSVIADTDYGTHRPGRRVTRGGRPAHQAQEGARLHAGRNTTAWLAKGILRKQKASAEGGA